MAGNETKIKSDNIVYGLSSICALIATIVSISIAYAANPFNGFESNIFHKIGALSFVSMVIFFIFFIFFLILLYPLIEIIFLIINLKNPKNILLTPSQVATDKPDNNNDNMFAWFLAFLMFLGVFWPSDYNNDDG